MPIYESCYSSNSPHCYMMGDGYGSQWAVCTVCEDRVAESSLQYHAHTDRLITYPRRNKDGSLDMRCVENRAAADQIAAAEALLAKKHAEAAALAAAEALVAKKHAEAAALAAARDAEAERPRVQVKAHTRAPPGTASSPSRAVSPCPAGFTETWEGGCRMRWAISAYSAAPPVAPAAAAAPAPPSALQLAKQLDTAIRTEAKRRVERERADEEARIQAEARRRLEAERAAADARISDDVDAQILAAMEAYRIIQ